MKFASFVHFCFMNEERLPNCDIGFNICEHELFAAMNSMIADVKWKMMNL